MHLSSKGRVECFSSSGSGAELFILATTVCCLMFHMYVIVFFTGYSSFLMILLLIATTYSVDKSKYSDGHTDAISNRWLCFLTFVFQSSNFTCCVFKSITPTYSSVSSFVLIILTDTLVCFKRHGHLCVIRHTPIGMCKGKAPNAVLANMSDQRHPNDQAADK